MSFIKNLSPGCPKGISPVTDTMIHHIYHNLSFEIVTQKEELIKEAINFMIGSQWTIKDITGRGEILYYPDKTEVFVFDGKSLIRFYPCESETERRGESMFLRWTQNYELLYKKG